ncbi:MAG TPA: hypothetical protein PLZ76_01735 [Bacillota bacterium]|nr:hypothetical protein [Bacillota bacterium]
MKIVQIKPAFSFTGLFLAVVCAMNIVVVSMQIRLSFDWPPMVLLILLIDTLGLILAREAWSAKAVRQGNTYVYLKGDILYFHERTPFGKERWSVIWNLKAFDHFFVRKSRLLGELLIGKRIRDGKQRILLRSGLLERSGSELAALFNNAKGPVVAAYREDTGEKEESIVS